jgi:hypothetical protein
MGVLDRLILRDDQRERMSQHIIGDERTRGSSGRLSSVDRADGLTLTCAPRCLAIGTVSFAVSAVGATKASGGASSRRGPTIRTLIPGVKVST